MERDDGGQAFPRGGGKLKQTGYATQNFAPTDGMTLLDYNATEAMKALIGVLDANAAHGADGSDLSETARVAYDYAEAMLLEKRARKIE